MTIRQISDVALGAFGPGVYKRVIQAMGLDLEYYNYKDCSSGIEAVASEKGRQPNTPTKIRRGVCFAYSSLSSSVST